MREISLQCNGGSRNEANGEQYFKTVHRSIDRDFSAKVRASQVQELKPQVAARKSTFTKPKFKAPIAEVTSLPYTRSHSKTAIRWKKVFFF